MKLTFCRNLICLLMALTLVLTGCSSAMANGTSFQAMKVEADDCSYGGEILSVEAVDAYSVKFTLCSPDASFPSKMTSPIFAIQDKDFLDSHQGDSAALTAETNGTGPFVLVSNDPTLPIQLSVSSSYWGTPPRITDIFFHWYKTTDAIIPSNYRSLGDVFNTIKPSALSSIQNDSDFTGIQHDTLNLVYIGFNNTITPMNDVKVRQAIAFLVSHNYLVQKFLPAGAEVATQVIPSYASTGRTKTLEWYPVAQNDAIELLRESSIDLDVPVTLAYVEAATDVITSPAGMADAIKRELKVVGMDVELKPMTQEEFDTAMANGTEMMFIDTFNARYNDGAAFYEIPLLRDTARFGTEYANLQQDLYSVQAQGSTTQRQTKFDQLNQDFKDSVPFIPVGYVSQWSYFRNTISSASTNSFFENYEDLSAQSLALHVYEKNRPLSLWPADETDYDTFRITKLIYDTLVTDGYGGTGLQPSLADSWEANSSLTEWTFYLRYNVKFSNGADLDANDVVASFAAIWDESSANHTGRTGDYLIFKELFGNLLPEP